MPTAPHPDLEQLAASRRTVLKDEPAARVEILGPSPRAVVRKTYTNTGLRLLQTFLRRSRAAREFGNLTAVAGRGLPCTPPLSWSERRRLGLVRSSTLVTSLVEDAVPLKAVLRSLPPATALPRRRLVRELGELLARLHRGGVLWCTPMPRNVLLVGDPDHGRLVLCDLPAAVFYRGPVPRAAAMLDLYDATASPSRRRELTRVERWRCLRAYAGDRRTARALWRTLAARRRLGHRLRKNLLIAWRTYILPGQPDAARGAAGR